LFLRLVSALDVTETFRLKKQALAAEGWDVATAYIDERSAGGYVALDAARAELIRSGAKRL
jgi:fatty-acyl-CoA synthase